jgi:acetylornithine deacetylase
VEQSPEERIVSAVVAAAGDELGRPAVVRGDMGWMDSGILVEAGIPCVVFGPVGEGEHTADEWVDLASVEACARVLERTARAFCG